MGHGIMHEPHGIRTGNYDSFHLKQALFGEKTPKKFVKKIKIWHPRHSNPFWTIWIDHNDKMFSNTNQSEIPHLRRHHYVCQSGLGEGDQLC